MLIVFTCTPGEGVRVDGTEIVMVKAVTGTGDGADILLPDGSSIALSGDQRFRLGPGLQIGVTPASQPGTIGLLFDAYIPIMVRHPRRDYRRHLPKRER